MQFYHRFLGTRRVKLLLSILLIWCLMDLYTGSDWLYHMSSNRIKSTKSQTSYEVEIITLQEKKRMLDVADEYQFFRRRQRLEVLSLLAKNNPTDEKLQELIHNELHLNKSPSIPSSNNWLEYDWPVNGSLPYFFESGKIRPVPSKESAQLAIWPYQATHDRIVNQLMYMPEDYQPHTTHLKKILIHNSRQSFSEQDVPNGRYKFLFDKCPVNTCEITRDRSQAENSHAIIFKDFVSYLWHHRPHYQVWIYYNLESAANTPQHSYAHMINWTATYRKDSELVAPYGKFVSYDGSRWPLAANLPPQSKDYASTKKESIAWFASNCGAKNGRMDVARSLNNQIPVHIYGRCGKRKCARTHASRCFNKLRKEYYYYLSLENSNCHDYITEKLFLNAYQNDVLPIVYGAPSLDYLLSVPRDSYLHVEDFSSISALSNYLKLLQRNHTMYNEHFRWKGTGEFINTFFWCRLCALLHAPAKHKSYDDLGKWWESKGTCTHSKHKNGG